jgi:preprotein translocase subunit SecA
LDEKNHSAVLTEKGVSKAEKLLGVANLYDPSNMELAALRRAGAESAHAL